jgi:hypothetical protein
MSVCIIIRYSTMQFDVGKFSVVQKSNFFGEKASICLNSNLSKLK